MNIRRQLSIFVENRPGMLARVCETMAKKNVNILALAIQDSIDHAVIRMVVDKATDAAHILGEAGLLVIEKDILFAEVENRPGILSEIAERCRDAKLNIEYAYCTATEKQKTGCVIISVSDPEQALKVIKL
ncbi:MAG: ACT domain-containing protein [Candidatus Omnitrophica bacterium]|nr:ACT domain-containing protein [Candidatus Omnitrophota bacterium]